MGAPVQAAAELRVWKPNKRKIKSFFFFFLTGPRIRPPFFPLFIQPFRVYGMCFHWHSFFSFFIYVFSLLILFSLNLLLRVPG